MNTLRRDKGQAYVSHIDAFNKLNTMKSTQERQRQRDLYRSINDKIKQQTPHEKEAAGPSRHALRDFANYYKLYS